MRILKSFVLKYSKSISFNSYLTYGYYKGTKWSWVKRNDLVDKSIGNGLTGLNV